MSIEEEIPAVGLISTRLRDLLARARTTKTTTAEVANLTTGNQYSAIETVARNIFNDSLVWDYTSWRVKPFAYSDSVCTA